MQDIREIEDRVQRELNEVVNFNFLKNLTFLGSSERPSSWYDRLKKNDLCQTSALKKSFIFLQLVFRYFVLLFKQ